MKAPFSFPLPDPESLLDVVVLSDSSLDLPAAVYGLLWHIRPSNLRLLWIAVIPGAGALSLADCWEKAPACHFGLTIVNMNDAMRHTPWDLSQEDKDDLRLLVAAANRRCALRADVFINDARFYPDLPPEYSQLVAAYKNEARDAGARVHDGAKFLGQVTLRDHMHFAAASTPAVVAMYSDAILNMSTADGSHSIRAHDPLEIMAQASRPEPPEC